MRKQCHRVRRRESAPTLVAYFLNPEVSIQERTAVQAISFGWATTAHFNVLADCRDMLALAAEEKGDAQTMAVCDLAYVALMNLSDRYALRQRFTATGDELQALRVLVDQSEDFWKRQSGSLFVDAEAALARARQQARSERAAA